MHVAKRINATVKCADAHMKIGIIQVHEGRHKMAAFDLAHVVGYRAFLKFCNLDVCSRQTIYCLALIRGVRIHQLNQ